ncbi:unnamed protein product [Heligmosomoides polygyrus]|uniref:Store-operated calcium entry-associated regulatory factor n=1 Tax=Heligmosomoides polygyrus TaxID=6339 RepID=A0A183GR98_HELPZ|nr:unnamed protein product [Heligmosomoides polygyrus]
MGGAGPYYNGGGGRFNSLSYSPYGEPGQLPIDNVLPNFASDMFGQASPFRSPLSGRPSYSPSFSSPSSLRNPSQPSFSLGSSPSGDSGSDSFSQPQINSPSPSGSSLSSLTGGFYKGRGNRR